MARACTSIRVPLAHKTNWSDEMKRALLTCVAALAAMLLLSAGAYFTDRAEMPDNLIESGTVEVSTEPTSAGLSIGTLAPGCTTTRTVNVLNEGDLPVNVVLSCAKKAGITDFFNALTCRVSTDSGVIYDGPMGGMVTAATPMAANSSMPVRFAVSMPATATNDLAGDYAKVSVYVDAEQSHP